MTPAVRVLVVDDDDAVLMMLQEGLQRDDFEVVATSNVRDALYRIANERFDVLLSDLHMPLAGDGLTVVSAMRHTHPKALTMILSGYPALEEAMAAILSQADEILAKPIGIGSLKEIIHSRQAAPRSPKPVKPESVASILERELETTIRHWLELVGQSTELSCISLNRDDRTGQLPRLLRDLIVRLRGGSASTPAISLAARDHGEKRHQQGYTASMVVEESRILQSSIFSTLQRNLGRVDFSRVLTDVLTIADEVDSQLKQAMGSYVMTSGVVESQAAERITD
jgi:ActR/RegA family two-component response regulator